MSSSHDASEYWNPFVDHTFEYSQFPNIGRVLDVGSGNGVLLQELIGRGHQATGIDVDRDAIARSHQMGLDVRNAPAENLPFENEYFDFVTSKVVLNYTDEVRALREIARVLKQGGIARLSMHGLGYYLRYMVSPQKNAQRIYAVRTIVNTRYYRVAKKRIPGWIGDTIYHSSKRIVSLCNDVGLRVESCSSGRRFLGQPVFLYVIAQKN